MSNFSLKPKTLAVLAFCCFFGLISCGKKKEKPAKAVPTVTVAACQKDNKILSKDGKTCLAACPDGQVNRGNQCVQPEKVTCGADEVKVEENVCEKISAASCQKAGKNLSRDGKTCVYNCAADEEVKSGQCIKKDNTQQPPACPQGQERGPDGKCKPKEPTPEPCPEGQERGSDGKCKPKEPTPEPCPEGQERGSDGKCKPKEPTPEPCPEGQERGPDGQCKPKEPSTGGLDQLLQKRQSAYSQIQSQGFNPVAGGTIKTEQAPGAVVIREMVINFKPGEISAEATEARFAKRMIKIERDRTQGWSFVSLHYSSTAVKATDLKLWAACLKADCSEIGFKGKALKKDGKEFVFKAKKQGDAYVVDPSGN